MAKILLILHQNELQSTTTYCPQQQCAQYTEYVCVCVNAFDVCADSRMCVRHVGRHAWLQRWSETVGVVVYRIRSDGLCLAHGVCVVLLLNCNSSEIFIGFAACFAFVSCL